MSIETVVGNVVVKKGVEFLLGHLTAKRQQRLLRQVDDLLHEMGRDAASEEEIANLLAETSPEVEDVLQLYFAILLTARGELTAKIMARMTARYWHQGKSSDTFFRRFGGMLSEIQDSELTRLARLVAAILEARKEAGAMAVELVNAEKRHNSGGPYTLLRFTRHLSDGHQDGTLQEFSGDAEYFAVFSLLRQHGFAQERPSGLNLSVHALALHLREDSWIGLEAINDLTSSLVP